jgi:hypothetical protein
MTRATIYAQNYISDELHPIALPATKMSALNILTIFWNKFIFSATSFYFRLA